MKIYGEENKNQNNNKKPSTTTKQHTQLVGNLPQKSLLLWPLSLIKPKVFLYFLLKAHTFLSLHRPSYMH